MFKTAQEPNDESRLLLQLCKAIEEVLTEAYSKINKYEALKGAKGLNVEAIHANIDQARYAVSQAISATHNVVYSLRDWEL